MENFGLTLKEADDLIRQEMEKYRTNKATGGRVGFANAGSVMKDPDEVVAGMDNELNPGITDQLLKGIDRDMGVDLIDKIQGLKYGKDFLGFDSLGYPETSKNDPMSMEQTIQYLENLFDQHIEDGNDPRKGGYFHDLGIYSKEDIRRRVELGYDSAKASETQTGIMKAANGGRVGFQIGGPAYDATDPIYGSSAITVTPDTIMGPQGNQIQAQTGVNPALQRSQNPFQNLGFLNTQKHFDQNQLLKNAVASGEITPEQYNELGGYDVTQTMAAGNPIMGGIGNLLGSTAYNVVQSLKGDQPFSDIFGDVYRNVKGGMGFISDDLKSKYESIINQQQVDPGVATTPIEQSTTTQPTFDRKATIERILKNIEPTFDSSQYSPLDLDYLKSLSPSEIKDELDAVYLEGRRFRDADYSSGRIGGGNPFFRYGPQYMEQFNIQGGPLQLSSQNIGYGLRKQLGELSPLIGEEALKSYTKRLDDSLIDYYRTNFTGDTDLQKSIFGIDPQYLNNGGRVGYAYGSGLKLAQLLQKAGKSLKDEIKKAVDDLIPTGDPKLDADMALDNMLEELGIDRDAIDGYDILDAYGLAYDELKRPLLKEIEETKSLAPKMTERFELKQKYPGIDDKLLTQIIDDPDPQRKAEVLATIDQAFELMRQGKSQEEVLDIMKQMTDRTKQASGGLSYLSGF
jgi:hypothetical protein